MQIRNSYSSRAQSKWKLLLSQNSLQDAGRNSVIYDYIHQARVEQISHISQFNRRNKELTSLLLNNSKKLCKNLLKNQSKEQSGLEKVRIRKEKAQRELEKKYRE